MEQTRNGKAVLFGKALAVFAAVAFALCLSAAFGQSQAHAATGDTQVMHRLYNPNSGEHFYTADVAERDDLVKEGWNYEGEGWVAPAKSNTPVYRLYNSHESLGDHHYTTDKSEYDYLVSVGWTGENIGWYSDDAKGVGLFRLYNPNAYPSGKTGAHHYTTSQKEHDDLVDIGWRDEKIAWYGVDTTKKDDPEPVVEQFTVKFVGADGKEISSAKYDKGTKAADVKVPVDPTKAADSESTYVFAGWDPAVADVTKDATYTATFTAVPKADTKADEDTGVAAQGGIFDEEKAEGVQSLELVVEEASDADKAAAAAEYADKIGDNNEVAGVFEVDLLQHNTDGTTEEITEGVGAMKLTFPVDADDDTKAKVIQLHEADSATPEVIEYDNLAVKDGAVTVTLKDKLSTFIVTTSTVPPAFELEISSYIEHGTITASPMKFDDGDTITFTIVPDENWKISWISLEDEGETKVYLEQGDGIAADGLSATYTVDVDDFYYLEEDYPTLYVNAEFEATETATWYNIAGDTVTGGTITPYSPSDAKQVAGEIASVEIKASEGYTLDEDSIKVLKADDKSETEINAFVGGANLWMFEMPAYDVIVTATFNQAVPQYAIEGVKDAGVYSLSYSIIDNTAETWWSVIESDATKAAEGDVVQINCSLNDGYVLDTVTVKDADGATVETKLGTYAQNGGKYYFTMPAGDATVTMHTEEISETFNVSVAVEGGHGTATADKSTFAPGDTITITAIPDGGYQLTAYGVSLSGDTDVSFEVENNVVTIEIGEWYADDGGDDLTVTITFEEVTPSNTYAIEAIDGGALTKNNLAPGETAYIQIQTNVSVNGEQSNAQQGTMSYQLFQQAGAEKSDSDTALGDPVTPGWQGWNPKYFKGSAKGTAPATAGEYMVYVKIAWTVDGKVVATATTDAVTLTVVAPHAITTTASTNGTFSVSDNPASSADAITESTTGGKVYIRVTPDENYKFDSATVTDKQNNTVSVVEYGNSSYPNAPVYFEMPDSDVTVSVTFVADPSYTVSVASGIENGTVSVVESTSWNSVSSAKAGKGLRARVIPNSGYQIASVTVTAENGDTVTVPSEPSSTTGTSRFYNFTMPASNVTVSATFVPETTTVTIKAKNSSDESLEVDGDVVVTIKDSNENTVNSDGGYDTNKYTLTIGQTYTYTAKDNKGNTYADTTGSFTVTSGMTEYEITMNDAAESGYTLNATASPEGSGTVEFYNASGNLITRAEQSDTVYVKATPASGYEVQSISGTCQGYMMGFTDAEDPYYKTFTMWGGDANVTVTFAESGAPATHIYEMTLSDFTTPTSTIERAAGQTYTISGPKPAVTIDGVKPTTQANAGAVTYQIVNKGATADADVALSDKVTADWNDITGSEGFKKSELTTNTLTAGTYSNVAVKAVWTVGGEVVATQYTDTWTIAVSGGATDPTATITATNTDRTKRVQIAYRAEGAEEDTIVNSESNPATINDGAFTAMIPAGATIKITVNDNNYEISAVEVSDSTQVTKNTDNPFDPFWQFTMPAGGVTITATVDVAAY